MKNFTLIEFKQAFSKLDSLNINVFVRYRDLAKEASHYGDHLITYQPMVFGRDK